MAPSSYHVVQSGISNQHLERHSAVNVAVYRPLRVNRSGCDLLWLWTMVISRQPTCIVTKGLWSYQNNYGHPSVNSTVIPGQLIRPGLGRSISCMMTVTGDVVRCFSCAGECSSWELAAGPELLQQGRGHP